jgi:hypothetical protein
VNETNETGACDFIPMCFGQFHVAPVDTVHRASHIYDALYVIYFIRSTLLYIFYVYQMNIKVN